MRTIPINSSPQWIIPNWPAPPQVQAIVTTRQLGNLAIHVGDEPFHVLANRQQLIQEAHLPAEPLWLKQVHGTTVIHAGTGGLFPEADAAVAFEPGVVCAVLTADCLPILLCNRLGTRVAAIHAGWRGLRAGIVESSVRAFEEQPQNILVYLGPAISVKHFEVGVEVFEAFKTQEQQQAFIQTGPEKWHADLYQLARLRLLEVGIGMQQVYGADYCTYSDRALFYSYRGASLTGRMASLIWLNPSP